MMIQGFSSKFSEPTSCCRIVLLRRGLSSVLCGTRESVELQSASASQTGDTSAYDPSQKMGTTAGLYNLQRSKTWCGRRDLNPHGPFKPCGFSYRRRLSPPRHDALGELTLVCGLDYPFTILRKTPELRCCPSSLYTFPASVSPGLARDCHSRFPRI